MLPPQSSAEMNKSNVTTKSEVVESGQSSATVEDANIVFKLELEEPLTESAGDEPKGDSCLVEEEKEEESSEPLRLAMSGPDGMPLAVPMMANTMHSSVTRNDAKIITETRLKRLRALSQRPDEALSKGQKDEKKRIVRLEKNRRAAAMSRRKKKIYVKNLEENSKLMARHIAILEMENSHLRAFMNAAQNGHAQPMPMPMPLRPGIPPMPPHHHMFKAQQFSGGNMAQFGRHSAASNVCPGSVHTPSSGNSLEPPTKRRKLGHDAPSCSVSDNCSEMDGSMDTKNSLEPLPLPIATSMPSTAPPAVPRMVPGHMMPGHMMMPRGPPPSRMMGYPMHHPMGQMMLSQGTLVPPSAAVPSSAPPHHLPEIGKLEGIVTESANKREPMDDCKSVESDLYRGYLDTMPPEVVSAGDSDYCHLSLLDDTVGDIDETVDECGSVIAFQPDMIMKTDSMAYL